MASELTLWWIFLCVATLANLVAWGFSAVRLGRRRPEWPAGMYAARRTLLWLAAAYMAGCAFRAVLPLIEVSRLCLYDVWLARPVITRSIATVAELCFAAQWALLLREAGQATGNRPARWVSRLLLPIIVSAEIFCWYAVLSGNYLAHALENSHWTLAALLATLACAALRPQAGAGTRRWLTAAVVLGGVYVLFMLTYDVPMYLARWQDSGQHGLLGRPLLDGWQIGLQRCQVGRDWTAWRADSVWLSLYFTVAVWASIALPHIPSIRTTVTR
jgi:hypothetical protein